MKSPAPKNLLSSIQYLIGSWRSSPSCFRLCGSIRRHLRLPGASTQYFIRWVPDLSDTNKVTVEIAGCSTVALQQLRRLNWESTDWQRVLAIYVEEGDLVANIGLPPMLGVYSVEGGLLRFRPQFPLTPRLKYRAVFHPGQLPGEGRASDIAITSPFHVVGRGSNLTTVVNGLYPSAAVLPENLLKFYIYFSAPMSRGRSYDHIHLQDESGKDVELPFLEIDEELWDPTMTRLTLFIDPGRIKRGVRPLEEIGPALQEGKRFTFLIDQEWMDAAGNPLQETFRRTFQVGPPDREPPDPAHWKIQPPKSNGRDPLTILFPEPMDYALAQRVIR